MEKSQTGMSFSCATCEWNNGGNWHFDGYMCYAFMAIFIPLYSNNSSSLVEPMFLPMVPINYASS